MRIAMIGATGLVGSLAAQRLLAQGHDVDALLRRSIGLARPGWSEHVAPAEDWPAILPGLNPDAAVSALGTTMRQAGSKAAFRTVDFEMVVAFARAAAAAGACRMVTVSSVGADRGSANFYLRTKGEMEAALEGMGFERLDIFRPGLLRGPRGGDRRPGERIGIALSPVANLFLRGRLDRYSAIDADVVAAAVASALREAEPGVFRHENRGIGALARTTLSSLPA
ncbi:MAG TPA: NAD(P)H-binding protein [Allosphingosinicella sp.]|nr:NAD(P)H-binding protein [Allosphingosinicella sp.]